MTTHKKTYKDSGVDVARGEQLVHWLQTSAPQKSPHQERIYGGIGGFAALFDGRFPNLKHPCLVSSTDGVGTKLRLALDLDDLSGLGQDLVAMCVNDLLCVGAQPLFFLDYYATGKLNLEKAQIFLSGLRKACHQSGCALIGGETAEMPGLYQGNDFDCAGFALGVVDREKAWGSHRVKVGDHLIALPSSGFHSNGYSLLRELFSLDKGLWKESLLRPTELYAPAVSLAQSHSEFIHAAAHITGGGMDNLLRVLPPQSAIKIKPWPLSLDYQEVQKRSGLSVRELLTTFNGGVGFVFFVSSSESESLQSHFYSNGYKSWNFGEVISSSTAFWEIENE